jgi:signal transduction histidine kinase/uncharacterized protein YoaH (UPF0181 family)
MATFAAVSVGVVAANPTALVILLIAVCIAAVAAMLRYLGVAYAVPATLAAILAFDWFYIPPTHPHAFPEVESLVEVVALIGVGVLVGELVARTALRAGVSELARSELAGEQAALRRVATLVAEGVAAPRLMAAVAEEAGTLLDVDGAWIEYYDGEDVVTAAEWSRTGREPPTFRRVRLEEAPVAAAVRHSGRVVRIDDFEDIQPSTAFAGESRVMSLVGAPIIVEGNQWGLMLAWSQDAPLPDEAEQHLTDFTELVATAIANTDARVQVRRLADEQAALRRVATLVAEGVAPDEVFSAVAKELGQLLRVDRTHLARYEPDGSSIGVGSWSADGSHSTVGRVVPVVGGTLTGLVRDSGRPERVDTYEGATGEIAEVTEELDIASTVGAPIVVDGRLWGVIAVVSKDAHSLPADTESRAAAFADLAATAISNTESRNETRRLAEGQAALRRVATLVAEDVPSSELFRAVATEVGSLLGTDLATLIRYEGDNTATFLSIWSAEGEYAEPPGTWSLEELELAATIAESGEPARLDDWERASGRVAEFARDRVGVASSAGCPIIVEGRLWGALTVHSTHEPLPPGTELQLGEFTELVATAISNVQARADLAASRARIAAAADNERRRVVRDLHDGAQQRLVHTVVTLNMARSALQGEEREDAAGLVSEALQHAEEATGELRELAHGILPSVLTRGGLRAGVGALASRTPVPVETNVAVDRLPPTVEATAYFVVAEALTNVAKHAQADHASVDAHIDNGELQIQVSDDGVGGADQDGTGFLGLGDRLAVHEGTLSVESPVDGGTRVVAAIPVR